MNPNKDKDVSYINDMTYFYSVILFNDNKKFVKLTQSAIKNLTIIEDILSPFTDAILTIDNSMDVLSRGVFDNGEPVKPKFEFNTTDNEYVEIEIIPRFSEDQNKSHLNDRVWKLKYTFVVDYIEDIPMEDPELKIKKLSLIDIDKYKSRFISKYSTVKYSTSEKESYLQDDSDRSLKTGEAIKTLLGEFVNSFEFSEDKWDVGGNNVFYTSPIGRTYGNDLNYLWGLHQSAIKEDFCILSKERSSYVWTLETFSDIASKALNQNEKTKSGEYQFEAFTIAESGDTRTIPKAQRVPTDYGFNKNTSFGDLSKVESFVLNEMSNEDDNLLTTISHSYDFDNGKFKIEHYDIDDTIKFFESEYSEKLRISNLESGAPFRVNSKNKNNVTHAYASLYDSNNTLEFLTRNKILQSAYLLGVGIEFTITGMTNRRAGGFFSIRRDYDFAPSDYENKLQGQWFCVRVEHVFSEGQYNNNIVGMKLNKLESTA